VAYIDTLHLFPETAEFLKEVEERYQFTALRYLPKVRPSGSLSASVDQHALLAL
jgi:3'-phosphoadenosine 5'-phosphosulfate sulfotransferase (PAPS reductase)/FAD synthetase